MPRPSRAPLIRLTKGQIPRQAENSRNSLFRPEILGILPPLLANRSDRARRRDAAPRGDRRPGTRTQIRPLFTSGLLVRQRFQVTAVLALAELPRQAQQPL